MTITELQTYFQQLYGQRNAAFINGLRERIIFLILAVGDLQNAIRKIDQHGHLPLRHAFASVVGWTFCVANHFPGGLSLSKWLASKYPTSGCAYCGSLPCACGGRRPPAQLVDPSVEQLGWSLREWQEHLWRCYGERNRRNGIENNLNRLFREACEVLEICEGISDSNASAEEVERETALELCDVLAWICPLASMFSLDLEHLVFDRYGQFCPTCSQVPCSCGRFVIEQGHLRRIGTNTNTAAK